MGKEYIPLFLDFNETTQDLSDEECGRLIRAIIAYANDEDYEAFLEGGEKIAFRFLKGLVDRNAAISEKRSQAGSKKNKDDQDATNENKNEQIPTNKNKNEQTETNFPTETKTKTETNTKNQNKDNQRRFDLFWTAYPRHEAKANAKKAFDKHNPDDDLLNTMLKAIEQQKASDQWMRDGGQYIPHPATWLNQRRWEDEPIKAVSGSIHNLPAQNYNQRDYSNDQDDMVEQMMQEWKRQQEANGA